MTKRNAEMQVWSLFKYIVILRKRENLISVSLEMHLIYFSIWEAHIDNSKSNKFFMRNLLQPPPQMLGWSTLIGLSFTSEFKVLHNWFKFKSSIMSRTNSVTLIAFLGYQYL